MRGDSRVVGLIALNGANERGICASHDPSTRAWTIESIGSFNGTFAGKVTAPVSSSPACAERVALTGWDRPADRARVMLNP